jgi:DNA repair photolyase
MAVIYEPTGKAREYAPLSCNLYNGCDHGCLYCYAPGIRRSNREDYLEVTPRRNIIKDFESDCKKRVGSTAPVLFCFMTDPYNHLEPKLRLTREALKIALKYKIPVMVLTKSVSVLDDLDVLGKYGDHALVGMTLTSVTESVSRHWEPKAALPRARMSALEAMHDRGIPTWASFEPVFDPAESLAAIEKSLEFVDVYKLGKLNNYQGLDKKIDWNKYLDSALSILRSAKKKVYVKQDLRESGYQIALHGNEVKMDDFLPIPFDTGIQQELFEC